PRAADTAGASSRAGWGRTSALTLPCLKSLTGEPGAHVAVVGDRLLHVSGLHPRLAGTPAAGAARLARAAAVDRPRSAQGPQQRRVLARCLVQKPRPRGPCAQLAPVERGAARDGAGLEVSRRVHVERVRRGAALVDLIAQVGDAG